MPIQSTITPVTLSLLNYRFIFIIVLSVFYLSACGTTAGSKQRNTRLAQLYYGEDHFTKIKQLTFSNENERASFTPDSNDILFQSTHGALRCYAIFLMKNDGSDINKISSGYGIATAASVSPDGNSIIYSSTQAFDEMCPTRPEFTKDYVWLLNPQYDIFTSSISGGNATRLTKSDGYDGGAVYSPDGKKIVFSSSRSGDLELYLMDSDGSNLKQLTNTPGYDGDAVFSRDGNSIVWRASRPTGVAFQDYRFQLSQGKIRAGKFDIYIMTLNTENLTSGKVTRLTNNGAANFSPTFDPEGKNIIFSSNLSQKDGRNYDLYSINLKTKKQERLTYYSGFDGYPVFSSDGKKLLFTSSRNFRYKAETNIYSVNWVAEGIYN